MKTNSNLITEQQNAFNNLFNAIKAEKQNHFNEWQTELNKATELKSLQNWRFDSLIPKSKNGYEWTIDTLKAYLLKRKQKQINSDIQKEFDHLNTIAQAGDVISVNVTIEWKKSSMWGSNPRASAKVETTKGYFYFNSGSIGGCGYDKGSTAVANVLNQSNALLNMLYKAKELQPNAKNNDLFSYGAGYGILPSIEGGVGVSCYDRIFNKIGLQFKTVASGKNFDVYSIAKIDA